MTKAEENEEIGINPWKNARISSVPLDFVLTLTTKSGRQSGGSMYFRLAPAESDVSDALTLADKEDLAEGKVPVFYLEDFKLPKESLSALETDRNLPDEVSPLYFRKSELIGAWRSKNPGGSNPPQVKVSELKSIVTEMVRLDGADEDLKSLVFIPPSESTSMRKECEKRGGKENAYIIGERIVIY